MASLGVKDGVEVSSEVFSAVKLSESSSLLALPVPKDCWLLGDNVLLAPAQRAQTGDLGGEVLATGLRRVVVASPWACSELLAAAATALAEVGVPFVAVSGGASVSLFLPQEKLGRALAALRQARLERFRYRC